ncbi:DUF695 domain-containing protein [Phycisphaerales bacterium AB-hyl4]|uniref:DUF695 domain-containing protein n=1 Tax=Natronomicrosphaera hydrolytica TaxID=3242702 RepID=A0ABV4U1X5_9BACT
MSEFHITIPEERHVLVEFQQDNMPGLATINGSLSRFEPKAVFAWHLSLMIQLKHLADRSMPSIAEQEEMYAFGDTLDTVFKGSDQDKPNALFLARITWNGTHELIYRVYDPELPNAYLIELAKQDESPRPFDYRIDNDPAWELARWHMESAEHRAPPPMET